MMISPSRGSRGWKHFDQFRRKPSLKRAGRWGYRALAADRTTSSSESWSHCVVVTQTVDEEGRRTVHAAPHPAAREERAQAATRR
jgi:hypothetical protein